MTIATFLRYILPFPGGLAEVGSPLLWGGVLEGPAAEDVPGGDFGDSFEFDQLVFGGLGEFDAV